MLLRLIFLANQLFAHAKKMKKSQKMGEKNIFFKFAHGWKKEKGIFALLFRLNPLRIQYVLEKIEEVFCRGSKQKASLERIKVLDAGCGIGLVAEKLAEKGAFVTAIDASYEAIKIARKRAKEKNLKINYISQKIEKARLKKKSFDVIIAFEVIEHVDNAEEFIKKLSSFLKPGGLIFVSTFNRTILSFLLAIIAVEYVFKIMPCGTHDWIKFKKPYDLIRILELFHVYPLDIVGIAYDPTKKEFFLNKKFLSLNYILSAQKN